MEALIEPYLRLAPHPGQHRIARLLKHFVKPKPGERIVLRDGLKWSLDIGDFASHDVYWFGATDGWVIHHLLRVAPPSPVFFDIGANMGYYSLKLAKEMGARFRAIAFEPFPDTFARLERNIALNGFANIQEWPLGLSDVAGRAGFQLHKGNSGGTSLVAANGGATVETITLDAFCEGGDVWPGLVKIDVEGFEAKVLRGGQRTLSRLRPPLVIEFMPPNLRAKGSSPAEIRDLLEGFGYRLHEIDRTRLRPLTRLPDGDEVVNVMCLPA